MVHETIMLIIRRNRLCDCNHHVAANIILQYVTANAIDAPRETQTNKELLPSGIGYVTLTVMSQENKLQNLACMSPYSG